MKDKTKAAFIISTVSILITGCQPSPESSIESCINHQVTEEGNKLIDLIIKNPIDSGKGFSLGDVSYTYYDSNFDAIRNTKINSYKCWTDNKALTAFKEEQGYIIEAKERAIKAAQDTLIAKKIERVKKWEIAEAKRQAEKNEKIKLIQEEFDIFVTTIDQSCLAKAKTTFEESNFTKVTKTEVISHYYAYNRRKQALTMKYTLTDGRIIVKKDVTYCNAGEKYSASEFENKLFVRPKTLTL